VDARGAGGYTAYHYANLQKGGQVLCCVQIESSVYRLFLNDTITVLLRMAPAAVLFVTVLSYVDDIYSDTVL
jgi:hypothetical protein